MGTATVVVGAVMTATALLAALVVTSSLHHGDGHGILGWKGVGPGSGDSNREVLSPVVTLRTRLLKQSATEVFTVRSPVASYWRLTSLDEFTGVQWQSTDSYVGVSHQLPGTEPPTPGTRIVNEQFTIQALDSIWMPTAFSPESISGGGQVSWDKVSGSLLAAKATSDGLKYSLTSAQHLSAVSAASLLTTAAPAATAGMQHYLQLPASVPGSVRDLARRITAGARSNYQKALALQNYFIDDPAFSYTLDPPVDGYGISALTTFLFDTKQGYCQQFAGAYAVLARAIGLPTRLAIGFTTGDPTGPGTYQVRNADAHTWPEVWFGSSVGWLPFEPTKGGDFAIPGATGYTGNTARVEAAPPTTQNRPTPTTAGGSTSKASPHPLPRREIAPVPVATVAPHHAGTSPALVAAPALVVALALWTLGNELVRRIRWSRRRRRMGRARVLAAWDEVAEVLAWWGCRRRADETPHQFATRAGTDLRFVLRDPTLTGQLADLAERADAAAYGDVDPTQAQTVAAATAAGAIVTQLEASAPGSRRLTRAFSARASWQRGAPVDPAPSFGDRVARGDLTVDW